MPRNKPRNVPCDIPLWQPSKSLGYAKGLHKMHAFQLAIGSLPVDERFKHENIMLYSAVNAKVAKKLGLARVLCGVDEHGTKHDEPCLATDMQELAEGVWIDVPGVDGVPHRVRLRAWIVVLAADFMEAAALLPFYESPAAHFVCRCCDFNQSSDQNTAPFSFLGGRRSKAPWKLRTWAQVKRSIDAQRAGSESRGTLGVCKQTFAFHPDHIPLVNPTTIAPQDAMHLFLDGITRHELAWLHYILLSLKYVTWEQLVRAYQRYRWPPGVRIPPLPKNIQQGVTGGFPRAEATLGMSASQTMYVALHR